MRWEYKVVWTTDLVPDPDVWQMPSSKVRQWGAAAEDCLNRMAEDGWEFVDSCTLDNGSTYLIFRRQAADLPPKQEETAIKEVNRL